MVRRFHADPRVRATDLLLQERVPREAPTLDARPVDDTRAPLSQPVMTERRFRSPHSTYPHTQFLSNGQYVVGVTNSGAGRSLCRGLAVTRWRDDATCDSGGVALYIRDVRAGTVWSAGLSAHETRAGRLPGHVPLRSRVDPPARRRPRDVARHRGIDGRRRRGAPAHADEPGRPCARARSHKLRGDRAGAAGRGLLASGVRQAVPRDRVPPRRARPCCVIGGRARPADRPAWAVHVLGLDRGVQGPVEWDTDRAAFLGRGRTRARSGRARRPAAVAHGRRRARSDSEPATARAARARRGRAAVFCAGRGRRPRERPKRSRAATTTRARPRARWRWPSRTRSTP